MQPAHIVFHILELAFASAMAGIIFCGEAVQVFCITFQGLIEGQFGEMKTANQNVRPKPVCDVHDSPVRAAAEEDSLLIFFQEQILLMAKIFRDE